MQLYPDYAGRIINAYVEAAVQRASGDPAYDAERHAKALSAFDRLITRLAEADDMLDYLDDWCSSSEVVIARGCGDSEYKRVDTETSGERVRDRMWINLSCTAEGDDETFRDALREVIRGERRMRDAGRARSEESDHG
jgi:hypothetical protein